jgi:hypothetical protein
MEARVPRDSAAVQLGRLAAAAAVASRGEAISSVGDLSAFARLTTRALEYKCEAAGLRARELVYFVQCLRAVLHTNETDRWNPAAFVASGDARTVKKVLVKARLHQVGRPTVPEFIDHQALCPNPWFKTAVTSVLRGTGQEPPQSRP